MIVIDVALVVLALCMAAAILRIVAGPTDAGRAVAFDYGFFVATAAVALLAVRLDILALLDLVLATTVVGFLATVGVAYLVERTSP